ncbi:MAG: transcriptional regulator [Gammaproteobacteria bacterium]|nr:transcriptional regulator [Gammaproteobacteria bacterium]
MRIPVTSVETVGAAIRAIRKVSGIRQDDVPSVSHMFLRDLEKGKETVQFGLVLKVLDELGIRMVLEVQESHGHAVAMAMDHLLPKDRMARTRTSKKDGE